MKTRIVIYISVFQLIIISLFVGNIINKRKQVLGTSINPISKNDIVMDQKGSLKYFYEPKVGGSTNMYDQAFSESNINSDSLNETQDYSPQKPENSYRIITLGDSITFGAKNKTKDNWTEVLEVKLNSEMKCSNIKKFEVINLGVPGYDTQYILERYKRRGIKYNPDLIIWLHVDLLRYDEALMPKMWLMYKEANEKNIVLKMPFEDAREEAIRTVTREKILNEDKNAIYSLSKYFTGDVIMIPYSISVSDEEKKWLINVTNYRKNWYYFDGIRDLRKLGGLIKDDAHPNEKGHKIIAEDIYKYLAESSLITCKQ